METRSNEETRQPTSPVKDPCNEEPSLHKNGDFINVRGLAMNKTPRGIRLAMSLFQLLVRSRSHRGEYQKGSNVDERLRLSGFDRINFARWKLEVVVDPSPPSHHKKHLSLTTRGEYIIVVLELGVAFGSEISFREHLVRWVMLRLT